MQHNSLLNTKKEALAKASASLYSKNNQPKLAVFTHLSEAIAAVNGTVRLGFERNLSFAAASCANCGEEFTGTTSSVLASITASLAALGLILEAAFSVEFLFTSGENEFVTAFFAY